MKLFFYPYKLLNRGLYVSFFILFSNFSTAINTTQWFQYYPFLTDGFKISEYEKCDKSIHQCPINEGNIFLDRACINKILNSDKSCKQVKQFLDVTGGDYNGLIAEQIDKFGIMNILSIGDNKDKYYIISPAGYLITTTLNPTNFNSELRNKYPSEFNIIANFDKPTMKNSSNGVKIFTFVLSARNCMGCETILCANVKISFEKSGKPLSINVQENRNLCLALDKPKEDFKR